MTVTVTNGSAHHALYQAVQAGQPLLVHFVSNSNTIRGDTDRGRAYAFAKYAADNIVGHMRASTIVGPTLNNGSGVGGHEYGYDQLSLNFAGTGVGNPATAYWLPASLSGASGVTIMNTSYASPASGSHTTFSNNGFTINHNTGGVLFDCREEMKLHSWNGFTSGTGGTVSPGFRRSGVASDYSLTSIDLSTDEGIKLTTITKPANVAHTFDFQAMLVAMSGATHTWPYNSLFGFFEASSRTGGVAVDTFVYYGGEGLEDIYDTIDTVDAAYDSWLANRVTAYRQVYGAVPELWIISEGLNSRNETQDSTNAVAASNTAAGYIDNATAIQDKILEQYAAKGYSTDTVFFAFDVEFPPGPGAGAASDTPDATMLVFNNALKNWVVSGSAHQAVLVDTFAGLLQSQLIANGDYDNGGVDPSHLNAATYDYVAGEWIEAWWEAASVPPGGRRSRARDTRAR